MTNTMQNPDAIQLDWFGNLIDLTGLAQSNPVLTLAVLTFSFVVFTPKLSKMLF